jgi:hypothetical protein
VGKGEKHVFNAQSMGISPTKKGSLDVKDLGIAGISEAKGKGKHSGKLTADYEKAN